MINNYMMKCGHAANAICNDKPCCVICAPNPDAYIISDTPNLNGRKAKCDCGKIVDSEINLAFFEWLPNENYDRYYCGHSGWD